MRITQPLFLIVRKYKPLDSAQSTAPSSDDGHFELLLWLSFALPLSAILSKSLRNLRAPKRMFQPKPRKERMSKEDGIRIIPEKNAGISGYGG